MAKQLLGRGSSSNDGTGDNLRDGANKINLNFNEIYTAIGCLLYTSPSPRDPT